MAATVIDSGAVTSWANTTDLISAASAPSAFTLNLDGDAQDTTAFGSGVTSLSRANGLYSWTATIESRLEPFSPSSMGLVTYANGYAANVNGWQMNLSWGVQDTTVFNGTPPVAKSFSPLLLDWSGSYTALLDDTTALVLPASGAEGSATFKYVEDTADQTLAGTVITTTVGNPVRVGQIPEVTIGFAGDGALTAAGSAGSTWADNWFDYWITNNSGVVGIPTSGTVWFGELVMTAHSGRTYTGDAFVSGLAINCRIGQPLTLQITAQGTGALAIG